MNRRRTIATALLGLLLAAGAAPALADGSAAPAGFDRSTERVCVFLGSDPADRQGVCAYYPWPL